MGHAAIEDPEVAELNRSDAVGVVFVFPVTPQSIERDNEDRRPGSAVCVPTLGRNWPLNGRKRPSEYLPHIANLCRSRSGGDTHRFDLLLISVADRHFGYLCHVGNFSLCFLFVAE